MNIVLLNGYVVCLKTTLGYLLAPVLNIGHVTNSVLGEFVSDASAPVFQLMREARYQTSTAITRQYLHEGVSVLLDGTYARRAWRKAIYQLADEFGVTEVIAITCVCSQPHLIHQRLAYRQLSPETPDAAANHWSAYLGSVRAFESIEDDVTPNGRRVSRLTFDSGTFTLRRNAILTPYAETVALAVERIIDSGRLRHPHFGLGVKKVGVGSFPARRLVALEGVGGSGKTTQSKRLKSIHARAGQRTCLLEEFSDGTIGEQLRKRVGRGDDQRIRVTANGPSHTESILVVGDALARVRELHEARVTGAPVYDLIVADGHIWSHLAHGLALLPEDTNPTLVQCMASALGELLVPLGTIADYQQTIYLRVAPDLAVERIESRIGARLSTEARRFLTRIHKIDEEFALTSDVISVDGDGSPDEVSQRIVEAVSRDAM